MNATKIITVIGERDAEVVAVGVLLSARRAKHRDLQKPQPQEPPCD